MLIEAVSRPFVNGFHAQLNRLDRLGSRSISDPGGTQDDLARRLDRRWLATFDVSRDASDRTVAILKLRYRRSDRDGIVVLDVSLDSNDPDDYGSLEPDLVDKLSLASVKRLLLSVEQDKDEFRRRAAQPRERKEHRAIQRMEMADEVLRAEREAHEENANRTSGKSWKPHEIWCSANRPDVRDPAKQQEAFSNHVAYLKRLGFLEGRVSLKGPHRKNHLRKGAQYEAWVIQLNDAERLKRGGTSGTST